MRRFAPDPSHSSGARERARSTGAVARRMTLTAMIVAAGTPTSPAFGQPDFSYSRPMGPREILSTLPAERPSVPRIRFGVFRPFNPIDNFILDRIQRNGQRPARLCTDWDFARRASLDLVGVIPTAVDLERYFQWPEKTRRAKWVDFLLQQPQYADHWTIFWGDLLREQGRVRGAPDNALKEFIHRNLRENVSFDVWVRGLITAEGSAADNPAVGFILRDRGEPATLTVTIAQGLLGIQLRCAQCHDHPYDWWTREDFAGMSRFWEDARVRRTGTREIRVGGRTCDRPELGVFSRRRGGTGVFLTGAASSLGGGRDALADLITRRDNPYFARVAVNRLWAKLMGTGLVNPVDRFSALNPPSHPDLLDWLAMEFVDSGYDLKHVLRLIATSRTYQQTSRTDIKRLPLPASRAGGRSGDPDRVPGALFEAMPLRRMTAEQVHDSILAATGRYWAAEPWGEASIRKTYPPPPRDFLRVFGCSDRETVQPRNATSSIQQCLTLLNGRFVHRAVRLHGEHPLLYWGRERGLSPSQLIEAVFVQFLTRPPTTRERRLALTYVGDGREEWVWEDLQWVLINTREFQYIR